MARRLLVVLSIMTCAAIPAWSQGAGPGVTLQDDFLTPGSPGVTQVPGGYRISYSALMENDSIPPGSLSSTDPIIVDSQTSQGGNWASNPTELTVFFGPSFACSPSGTCSYSVRDAQGVQIPGATALINFQGFPPIAQAFADLQVFANNAPPFIIDVFANDAGFPADPSLFTPVLDNWPADQGSPNLVFLPNGRRAIEWIPSTTNPPCGDVVVTYFWVGCLNIPSPVVAATFRFVLPSGDCNSNCVVDALEPDDDQDGIPNDCEVPIGDANAPLCSIVNAVDETSAAGTATDNRPSEDTNGNQFLEPGEDLNSNGQIDIDTGVASIVLLPGAVNLTLDLPAFVPGAPLVQFAVNLVDTSLPGTGTVRITDVAGNPRDCPVSLIGAECHLFLGFGPGQTTHSIHGHGYASQMSAVRWTYPVTMQQAPTFLAPSSLWYTTRPVRVEVHMWNPTMFPNNPQQWSQVVTVRGTPGGTNTVEYSGTSNGISIQCQFFSDANGVLRMRFPFQIAGM